MPGIVADVIIDTIGGNKSMMNDSTMELRRDRKRDGSSDASVTADEESAGAGCERWHKWFNQRVAFFI